VELRSTAPAHHAVRFASHAVAFASPSTAPQRKLAEAGLDGGCGGALFQAETALF
jgi:hypothetical protein